MSEQYLLIAHLSRVAPLLLACVLLCSCEQNSGGGGRASHATRSEGFQLAPVFAPSKPGIPVIMTQRDAWYESKAIIFSNQTAHQLTITVELGKDGKYEAGKNLDLPPNGRVTLGWMEGYPLSPDIEVRISHPDYSPRTAKITK